MALAGKPRSNPEAHQPDLTGRGFNHHIVRLNVFVNQPAPAPDAKRVLV
jgi:hypothetical protein